MTVIGTARIVCEAGSMKRYGVRSSFCPSVCPSMSQQQQTRCCRFAAVGPAAGDTSIDRLLQQRRAAGECGHCHVVSVRGQLNTDLFIEKKRAA